MDHSDRTADKETRKELRKLAELISEAEVGMLTTRDLDGTLRSRPLAALQVSDDGDLWFFTSVKSPKIREIEEDNRVNVSFARPSDQNYVSLSGRARILRDPKKAHELWTAWAKVWFPDGPDDPELVLLNVRAEKAEYWDTSDSIVGRTVGLLKALAK
ncbi:MAG TPA: pyridoxamine 5'-phosphate oxidase family protein, partial [Steroidobacteraceae bacterium]|nr:pyridoxamine 5'-phosphate oxidase family protein [Steroidobacteraceae bacterium]